MRKENKKEERERKGKRKEGIKEGRKEGKLLLAGTGSSGDEELCTAQL